MFTSFLLGGSFGVFHQAAVSYQHCPFRGLCFFCFFSYRSYPVYSVIFDKDLQMLYKVIFNKNGYPDYAEKASQNTNFGHGVGGWSKEGYYLWLYVSAKNEEDALVTSRVIADKKYDRDLGG